MGVAQRRSSPIAGPGKVHAPVAPTINGPNRLICLVRSVPNVEPAPPSCCRLATAKPCSSISTRSQPKSPSERTPLSSLIRPDGMAPKPWWFRTTSHSCRCRRAHPNSTARKTFHASELVVKPDFQILRRYRRPLLLRLEHTHRPTLEDYVHRATRLGSSRSLN